MPLCKRVVLCLPSMKANAGRWACACVAKCSRASSAHSSVAKKLSHIALSYASPTEPTRDEHPLCGSAARRPARCAGRIYPHVATALTLGARLTTASGKLVCTVGPNSWASSSGGRLSFDQLHQLRTKLQRLRAAMSHHGHASVYNVGVHKNRSSPDCALCVELDFYRPGTLADNAEVGSFSGRFTQEGLNAHCSVSSEEARSKIVDWR